MSRKKFDFFDIVVKITSFHIKKIIATKSIRDFFYSIDEMIVISKKIDNAKKVDDMFITKSIIKFDRRFK